MAEFFYRATDGSSRRLVGPFDSEDEARKAARYKGIRDIEILVKKGPNYETVTKPAGAEKPA